MLPFLHPKKIASVIIARHKPEGGMEPLHEEGSETPELMMACEDLIQCIHGKDAAGVAKAFKDAFEACQSYPQEEGLES